MRKHNYLFGTKNIGHYSWILAIISIILASIFGQSSNRNWILGSSGKVKWSQSCDFVGKHYAKKSGIITTKGCEDLCLADNRCTHFTSTWTSGKCFLKTSNNSVLKDFNKNGIMDFATVCGYVIDRVSIFKFVLFLQSVISYCYFVPCEKVRLKVKQVTENYTVKWRSDGGNGTYKWGSNCNFPERDIEVIPMQESTKCGGACLVHKRCTNFAYYNGKCYLKMVNGSPGKPINKPGGICGFIVERVF